MPEFEIMFEDLSSEAQERLCMEFNTSPDDENWDVFPLVTIEKES